MRNYYIKLANEVYGLGSPLVVNAAYYNTKMSGNTYLTLIPPSTYELTNTDSDLELINSNTMIAKVEKSYTVFLHDSTQTDNVPVPFSFYAYQAPFIVNSDLIYNIINQELPPIYSPENEPNDIDNKASAGVIEALYTYIYELYFNALGTFGNTWYYPLNGEVIYNATFNNNWELVYLGANNILQNTKHPNFILELLINVNSQISTQVFSIAIGLSKFIFGLTNVPVPVQIVYNDAESRYDINIYYDGFAAWILGDPSSSLGVNTFLAGNNTYIWLIGLIVNRWMPSFVKWQLNYLPLNNFMANFNVADVTNNDFIDPSIKYDAYQTVSTNNIFNVQGYFLNG